MLSLCYLRSGYQAGGSSFPRLAQDAPDAPNRAGLGFTSPFLFTQVVPSCWWLVVLAACSLQPQTLKKLLDALAATYSLVCSCLQLPGELRPFKAL